MKQADELARENAMLRERLSRLGEANLLINESFEFDTVLQRVLDHARALSEACFGIIALLDSSGKAQDFLSSGITTDEHEQFMALPEGPKLFEHFSKIVEPLRLRDFHSHIKALGLPAFNKPVQMSPILAILAAPIRHREQNLGVIYLADKIKNREFSGEDEDILAMFASQAAVVITNARRYREEQETRAYPETLINTSPIGVVVFNAKTGELVSYNHEMARMFEGLRIPGYSLEHLLRVMTI